MPESMCENRQKIVETCFSYSLELGGSLPIGAGILSWGLLNGLALATLMSRKLRESVSLLAVR